MKRFLCILFTMILLGSLLVIPVFASSEVYFAPGDYLFSENPFYDFMDFDESYYVDFRFFSNGQLYSQLIFGRGSGSDFFISYQPGSSGVFRTYGAYPGWLDSNYRTISVVEGFYVSDPVVIRFLRSNLTPLDSSDFILPIFSSLSSWFIQSFTGIIPMFFAEGRLTVLGFIFIVPLAFIVVFLFINFLIASLLFRR